MAIYGVGANYDNNDVSQIFINDKIVATGWNSVLAPDIHEFFADIDMGDIVYLKACTFGSGITVKAIGIIQDDQVLNSASGHPQIEIGRNVKWIYTKRFVISKPLNQKNNVRANTIYREFHPDIIALIMNIVNNNI